MLRFDSDYMEGAHPLILQKLSEINFEKNTGYGFDPYCEETENIIRELCACPEADVYFLPGGTQANATVIDYLLRSHQGVLTAVTGHINGHEAGAVEAHGHKVITLPQEDGKISPQSVADYMDWYLGEEAREHIVEPGMVYVSHPTEYGSLYTYEELKALSEVCRRYGLYLYMDGARMGYGLAAADTDVDLPKIASLCDAFYIGGTKCGALFGEAVVFTKKQKGFFSYIKCHGGVTAKGWLPGVQFGVLLKDGLYMDICRHADELADRLRDGLRAKGHRIFIESRTNQVMALLPDSLIEKLRQNVTFSYWERFDENSSVIRFATSWATPDREIDELLKLL